MLSRLKWTKGDWFIFLALVILVILLVANNSGAAAFVKQFLHLLGGMLVWAGSALNSIGR